MSRPFAGKPVGARRNRSGEITHILFQRRSRAMPIGSLRQAVKDGITSGVVLLGTGENSSHFNLCDHTLGFTDPEELPEI